MTNNTTQTDYEFIDTMRSTLVYKKNLNREAKRQIVAMLAHALPYIITFLVAGIIFAHLFTAYQLSYHRVCQFNQCVVTNFTNTAFPVK